MEFSLTSLAHHYEEGGDVMPWLLALYAAIVGIGVERAVALLRASNERGATAHAIASLVRRGYAEQAVLELARLKSPVSRVLSAGLLASVVSLPAMRASFDGALLAERPRLSRRAALPKQLGDIAVLLGLLGTMWGLMYAMIARGGCDYQDPILIMAKGISEALNCTALGLLTGGVAILVAVLVDEHRRRALTNLDYSVAVVSNAVLLRHRDLRLFGRRAEDAPRGYRD